MQRDPLASFANPAGGQTSEISKEPRTLKQTIYAEMTGDSCLARAVVPRTAAAVDHADTELIGHSILFWRHRALCGVPACIILSIYVKIKLSMNHCGPYR